MQYYKHYSNMRHDIKLKRTIAKYGLEGYGLYCLILESITESMSNDSPMPELQETCEDIAEFYNGNTAKINEMANYMINQGLFDLSEINGAIMCHKLYKFLDTSQTRSIELRKMITSYKKRNNLLSETVSDKTDRKEEKRIEKNRKEEEEKRKEESPVQRLIDEWNKDNILPLYKRLITSIPDIGDILNQINAYGVDKCVEAIDNLKAVRKTVEAEELRFIPSKFDNFMTKSLESWFNEAEPLKKYAKPYKEENMSDMESRAKTRYYIHNQKACESWEDLHKFMETDIFKDYLKEVGK